MTDLFANISPRNKQKLLKLLEANTLNFKKNSQILSSVKWDNIIGIVLEGYMQIVRSDYNGNRTIIEELEENSIFGTTLSSLKNIEYEIVAKEDTKLIAIEYHYILSEANNSLPYYSQFIRNLLEIMNEKIAEKNEHIDILTKKSIRDKLLEYFKIMNKKSGSKKIYLMLNYTELADYISVDRCAMTRELKYLEEEGFIKREGKKITLLY